MRAWKRSFELIVIMVIAWVTMLIAIIAADQLIVPIRFPRTGYFMVLIEAIVKLLLAGLIALAWLLLWIYMVEWYKKWTARKFA